MIYLDNAATTLKKPPAVAEAVRQAILTAGNAARGTHGAAMAAARALKENTDLSAHEIAEKALHIAADICVFTNHNVIVEDA